MGEGLRTLLVLLAGALLGLVAGWWLFDRGPAASGPVALTAQAAVPPTLDALDVGHSPEVRSVATASAPLQPSRLVEPRREKLETRPGPTGGDGRLRGKVTTADNRPLRGVRVEIAQREDRPLAFDPARGTIPQGPIHHVARLVRTTDEQGSFEFAGLADALWDVQASAEGWSIEALRTGTAPVGSNAMVDFLARPLVELRISVLHPNGQPAERALIEARSMRSASATYQHWEWTQAAPSLQLPDGPFELRALVQEQSWLGPGHAMPSALASPAVHVSRASEPLELVLAPRRCLIGEVLDAQGARGLVPGTVVHCAPLGDGGLPEANNWPRETHFANVSEVPRYQFLDLDAGNHGLGLRLGGVQAIRGAVEVALAEGVLRKDLLISTTALPALHLRLYTPDGSSYAGDLNASLVLHRDNGVTTLGLRLLQLPEGLVEVPPGHGATDFVLGASPHRAAAVHLRTKAYGSTRVDLVEGQFEYEVRFVEPSSLTLHVDGARASTAEAWLRAQLTQANGNGGGSSSTKLDRFTEEGDGDKPLEFALLLPGSYELELVWCRGERGRDWNSRTLAQRTIQLSPGANHLRVEVPLLFELLVVGGEGLVGRTVQAHGMDAVDGASISEREKFNDLGEARLADLPPGRYLLTCDDRVAWAQVPGPPVAAPFAPPASLVVRLQDPAGSLAAAGFQSGDQILKVQGKALGDGPSVLDVLRTLGFGSEHRVRFDVERAGMAFGLELPLASVASLNSLGGSFHFAP